MKVVIATDSLKGSLSSVEAGRALAAGIKKAAEAEVKIVPMADGGEGTAEALVDGMGGQWEEVLVTGPLGNPVTARYGYIKDKKQAVIEMASAAGITLVQERERDIMKAGTRGVGEMIRDAVERGCRDFLIGIGGSATNDCGTGMLCALGAEFLDREGKHVGNKGEDCGQIVTIRLNGMMPELKECRFCIACDVTNPLYGENGASCIFGPQKGGTKEQVRRMERMHRQFADLTKRTIGKDVAACPGAGAAGGLGFAFLAFLNASLEPGIDLVMRAVGLEECVRDADYVITGEGCLDAQTVMGKVPAGVARLAKKYGAVVIAVAGSVKEEAYLCNRAGIDAFFPIMPGAIRLEDAMRPDETARNLNRTAEQIFRLLTASRSG
ncbi:glycerate kinase [Ruminococcus sp. OA3]|nr:glycerate kinase [Ruminococcus sp. OA3]MCH1983048.1 glycerate kinase [Ruminococcus sp. OA3]